ncbi:Uncharacterised protein [Starkeya nomas]|uniref:Uncharacterized protein n=1 Tax=Starkeya nomas TaxID=2666134 RepID=A0A5S9R4Z5_9HYPH|nr:hypothetical protein [Starkeya nomas]CAA0130240.1 Uncharacterised protein [Starkeya nomas]
MRKRPLDIASLRRLVGVVSTALEQLPPIDSERFASYGEHRKAAEAALDELARTEGARWRETGADVALSLGGVRASSTGGVSAAMRNWITSARAKIGGAV